MMIVADLLLVMAKRLAGVRLVPEGGGAHVMTQANMKAALSATMPPNVRGTGFAISAPTQGIALASGTRRGDCAHVRSARLLEALRVSAALGLGWLLVTGCSSSRHERAVVIKREVYVYGYEEWA